METITTYWVNSNTGDLITKQEFTETNITGTLNIYYYRNNKSINTPDLTGYVPLSLTKHQRYLRKKIKENIKENR